MTPRVGLVRLLDLMLIATPPLFWAGNFIVGRAMRDSMPPLTMGCIRWMLALMMILPFAWRPMRRDLSFYQEHPWRLAALSLAGVVAFNSLVYVGLRSTSAANGLLLNSTIPALIMLIGAAFFRQRLKRHQLLGLKVSLAGVATILAKGSFDALATMTFTPGDLVVFGGMVAWAFYTLWLRAVPPEIDRVGLLCVQIMVALPVLMLMSLGEIATGARPVWTPWSVAAMAYLGIFPSFLAYLAYNLNVMRVGPVVAGLSIHLIPAFGVVLAVALLAEPFFTYHAVGMVLIVVGLFCAGRRRYTPEADQCVPAGCRPISPGVSDREPGRRFPIRRPGRFA